MPEHVRTERPGSGAVEDLERHGLAIGADLRLVQGAGGNFSVTEAGVLWIKASGTRLSQSADREIYVPLDAERTRAAVLETEDLWSCVLPRDDTDGLRPSIETALHSLLPHRVVFHVHGVGSIAAGLTDEGVASALGLLPADALTVVVPYAKPGVGLARAVLDRTPADLPADRAVVLLLRNHGLVVGAATADDAAALVHAVEAALRTREAPPADLSGAMLCPAGTVDERAAEVLCAGALTPDSAVFLGASPFGRVQVGAAPASDGAHAGVVGADGSVWLRPDLGPDEREVAASLVDIARQAPAGEVRTLSAAQVDELVNWEAEKWRQKLKR